MLIFKWVEAANTKQVIMTQICTFTQTFGEQGTFTHTQFKLKRVFQTLSQL